jgi:tetratricopeptide (TPR) repeat protein
MIREDYVLSWIKRFVRMLAEIAGLVKADQHQAAREKIDKALREMLGLSSDAVYSMNEGEIMARLALGEPTQLVRDKCVLLAALLEQLGLACASQGRDEESQACFLKSLQIMLGIQMRLNSGPMPDHAPRIDELADRLWKSTRSIRIDATLMLHYEQTGQYAKAEDALFSLLEGAPGNRDAMEMGTAFYERLLPLEDASLAEGGLPREEVEAGMAELNKIKSRGENVQTGDTGH